MAQETAVQWVPDQEVQECPICERRFTSVLRKHHCRACGRVVCGSCSDHQVQLANLSGKQRVCNNCFHVQSHDKAASLTDHMSTNRQARAALKANLKEKHAQAEWYLNFLRKVASQTAVGGSAEASAQVSPGESPTSSGATSTGASGDPASGSGSPFRTEVTGLEARAKQRWRQVCEELKAADAHAAQLGQEADRLEQEGRAAAAEVRRLQQEVKALESELLGCRQVESERDGLADSTEKLRRELSGLLERKRALEATRPPQRFLSSSSFGSFRSAPGSPPREGTCQDRCVRPGCALQ